jgi:nitrate reductase gamma subunit
MPQHEPSALLHTVEIIHWSALAVMGLVYTIRLWWLLRFRATRDRQAPGNPARTDGRRGALYSLANVAMPWAMESTRRKPFFYATFVLFHLGVAAGIGLAFLSSLAPGLVAQPAYAAVSGTLLAVAFVVAVGRIVRRVVTPYLRLISSPDDYFSVIMLTFWFALGLLAQLYVAGVLAGEGYLVAFLLATSFFLIYVPFSKISHYLYYPFTRFWLGRTLGHRGSMPPVRA